MGQRRTGKHLAIYPELVDTRTDIILSDLTGNWERLYHQVDFHLPGIIAYPDAATAARPWDNGGFVNSGDFSSNIFRIDDIPFRDVFYIDDAIATILALRGSGSPDPLLRIRVDSTLLNPEITREDLTHANKIARPDISVSRINALNIALDPDPGLRGTDGKTFLDINGNPQTVTSVANIVPGNQIEMFTFRNTILERKLYVSYFDRNHKFRVGAFGGIEFRVGAISGSPDLDPDQGAILLNRASNRSGGALVVHNANLADYVKFFKQRTTFKYVIAHSSMWNSEFRNTASPEQILAAVGGNPIHWAKFGNEYRPSYAELGGTADLYIHRAMWHNNTLKNAGASILVHDGCDVNSVYGSSDYPYQSLNYGGWQNAEGILFFTNTVAVIARAKVLNDSPVGFPEGFRSNDRANVGMAFKHYYETQSNDHTLSTQYAVNKRAYNWSINGDWTVRLRNKNGLGILQLSNNNIIASHVHPDKAWIDDWNFDRVYNSLVCIGDINGDGVDEFVIRSEWGLGILKLHGNRWRQLLVAPRDTWFGGWRYDATVNLGRDKIVGAANLTDTGASELLVTSTWGLGCLSWNRSTLDTSFILQNGNRIGGWPLRTGLDSIMGFGNFDSTSQKEILITNPWGIGILSLHSKTSFVLVSNGTTLQGDWRIDLFNNQKIAAIADFDGDGKDEILITSLWGIVILKVQGNTMRAVAKHTNNTLLSGGYTVKNIDKLRTTGNFLGTSSKQAIVASTSGIHVLQLNGNVLTQVAELHNGERAGNWPLNTMDNRCITTADFDGNGRDEIFITSPWGIGIIGLGDRNTFVNPALLPYGTTLGDWCLERSDTFFGSGKFTGGLGRQILVKK